MKYVVPCLPVLAFAFVSLSIARANVIVVDASGGGAFTQIQPAVDVAQNGDTILVKSGTYGSFSIVNESIAVVADANATVVVNGGVQVRSLARDRDVVLAGLTIYGQTHGTDWHANGLYLKNNLGSVRIRCEAHGGSSWAYPNPPPCAGAEVVACADVAFEDSVLHGAAPADAFAGPGLVATDSSIAIYDSTVTGGNGFNADCDQEYGASGGAGAKLTSSFLFASGSSFQGGHGGNGAGIPACTQCQGLGGGGGSGGTGLVLAAGSSISQAENLDTQLAGAGGGSAGYCGLGWGPFGTPGAASSVSGGSTLHTLLEWKRVLDAPSVVRELAPLTLSFQGQARDEVGVLISTSTAFQFVPALSGVKLVEQAHPALTAWIGFADPITGHLDGGLTFPDLGPGAQSRTYHLQAIVRTLQGNRILGSPVSVVVLDSSF